MPTRITAEVGERYSRLTITRPDAGLRGRYLLVGVRCDCGADRVVLLRDLRYGRTKSCGCLRSENLVPGGIDEWRTRVLVD